MAQEIVQHLKHFGTQWDGQLSPLHDIELRVQRTVSEDIAHTSVPSSSAVSGARAHWGAMSSGGATSRVVAIAGARRSRITIPDARAGRQSRVREMPAIYQPEVRHLGGSGGRMQRNT